MTLPKAINLSAMHSVPHTRPLRRPAQERKTAIAHYSDWRAGLFSIMGLLASIFAYLSAVAAIIVFFLMSADALLDHAHRQAANPPSELVTAATINPHRLNKVAHVAQKGADALPKTGTAVEYRRKADLSKTRLEERHRRVSHRQQEARNRAPYREHATAPLALGYAQEPARQFGDEPWR